MVLFRVADLTSGRLFSFGILVLIAAYHFPFATGQQVGVSLKLHGVTIPNNSLVDLDDILYRAGLVGFMEDPSNNNSELHDQALLCVTDLEDCCESPRTVRGNWYYPDGSVVQFDAGGITLRANRGPNEIINGRQFYGSVRLFRRWSKPQGRGHFRCELPSAADPSVNQVLYANIVNFGTTYTSPVTLSPSGPGIAGNSFSLTCSATLLDPIPLPTNVPSPTFEWFFGTEGSSLLPSGVTPTGTTLKSGYIYTSTLLFSPVLNESHAGTYTCQLGAGRLMNSTVVSVAVAVVQINPNEVPVLGQSSYKLTCKVFITNNLCPTITYQWTKNNGTAIQLGTPWSSNTLSFSLLRLSDARVYTCYATISSLSLSSDITVMGSHAIRIQIPAPTSVMLSASTPTPIQPNGTLTCIVHVELSSEVNVPVKVNIVLTGPVGFKTRNTSQPVIGGITTYTTSAIISSLERNQSGNYTCTATLKSTLNNSYIISSSPKNDSVQVITGVYLALRNQFIANNSQVNIVSIGLSSDNPNGALQCITDRTDSCCSDGYYSQFGEWYLPDGTLVQRGNSAFFRNGGDNGEVFLNRPSSTTSPTGQFCCKIVDAVNKRQILCVIIDVVSITPIGVPIAGENYTLECSTGGSMATFQWMGPPHSRTPVANSSSIHVTIIPNSFTSQLQFLPLQQSHNGSYSCHAMTPESSLLSQPMEIGANAPKLSIQMSDSNSGAALTAGQNYGIICSVLGAENLDSTISYRWMKMSQIISNSNTHSLTLVRISDAGINYSCSATIASSYLTGRIAAVMYRRVRIQIPTPSFITLRSSVANSNQITIGSEVILTCTVELNSEILGSEIFLLTVDTQLSKDRAPLALTGPIVTGTTFTYTAQLNSFQRNDYGKYICTATIRPQPTSAYLIGVDVLSDALNIKPVIPPPIDVRATQFSSSAPLEISWSPPTDQGPFNITAYRIFYGKGQNILVPSVATYIGIRVNGGGYGSQTVFLQIRSESEQLHSDFVNVTVENEGLCSPQDMAKCPYSCSREIGTTIGVMICIDIMAVTAVIIAVVLCWWRKKSSIKKDLALSANMAYKEINFNDREKPRVYENVDMILQSSCQTLDNKRNVASIAICTSKPAASEYSGAKDPAFAVSQQQPL